MYMNVTKLIVLSVLAVSFAFVSCDKHSWEDTQKLHEGMHAEEHGDHGAHDKKHVEKAAVEGHKDKH
jgi:hypothetical protein